MNSTLALITTACACAHTAAHHESDPDNLCDVCEGSGRLAAEAPEPEPDVPDTRERDLHIAIGGWLRPQKNTELAEIVRAAKCIGVPGQWPTLKSRREILFPAAVEAAVSFLSLWLEEEGSETALADLNVALAHAIIWARMTASVGRAVVAAPETPDVATLPAPSAPVEIASETPEGTPAVDLAGEAEPIVARILGVVGHVAAAVALERERTSPEARRRQADEACAILVAGNARVRREAAEATLLDAVQGKWSGSAADLHASAGRARALGVDAGLVKQAHKAADTLAIQEKLAMGDLRLEPRQQPVRRTGFCATLGDIFVPV